VTKEVYVCETADIDEEDVKRFDYEDQTYCVYHTPDGFFASDGYCTHEEQHLEDGIVIDNVIECPLHQGRFDVRSGKALSAPVCVDLKTYPVVIKDSRVYLCLKTEPVT
jgi:3-phenylpropionate/trans-cinnamate dioxygenase ferredoxin subunit